MTNPAGNKRFYADKFCVRCSAVIPRTTGRCYPRSRFCGNVCYHAHRKFTPEQAIKAFWEKVDKHAANGCWLWTGSANNWGYGRVKTTFTKQRGAHRISWELHNGPIPKGLNALHKCDTPRCVNPNHLFLGTLKDNTADAVAKDRHARGERMRRNKLTAANVLEIRARYQRTMTAKELSALYGVTADTIAAAAVGKTWKHLK